MKWSDYNESLVSRGEILLGFDVIDNRDKELETMNRGKLGGTFQYPDTLVLMYVDTPKLIFIYHTDRQKISSKVM
ncbi:MAG: hypothetical protein R2685_15635 [Candidatus Nitrosocosmicus sp.]|nr:hypothetical protein [Candidatus Nitrosocosmicus sp.]